MANAKATSRKTRNPKSSEVQEQTIAAKKPPAAQPNQQPVYITFHIEKLVIQSTSESISALPADLIQWLGASSLGNDLGAMSGSSLSPSSPPVNLPDVHIKKAISQRADRALLQEVARKIDELVNATGDRAMESIESPRPPRSARELAGELFEHPEEWLNAPNSQLGDRKPIDLIGTKEEFRVQNLLNAVDLGLF